MAWRVPLARLIALASFTALVLSLGVYPLDGSWLAALLLAYMALLCWRPVLWLFALPALLPAVDLAPRTGWFFLAEMDLLLMATAGFCYWHLDTSAPALPRWPPLFRCGLALLAAACAIGLWRGLQPLAAIDANAFNNYLSPYNAVRVAKGWLWALILLPPLRQAAGPTLQGVKRLFMPGMLTGLLLVTCAAIGERLQFPGLLNFSSDYRISAPFSSMHTGGAALDGYLALTFPLLATWLFGRESAPRTAAALALLALALYAGLATFSRGLYLAYAAALAVLLCLPLLETLRPFKRRWMQLALLPPAAVLVLVLLDAVFGASGYRGYGAALLVLAAMLLLVSQPLRPSALGSGLIAGLAIVGFLAWLLPIGAPAYAVLKAPYLLFICSAVGFALAMLPAMPLAGLRQPIVQPLAALAYAGLLLTATWIALHATGAATLGPSAGLLALALLPLVVNLLIGRPLWSITPRKLTALLAGLLVLASVVPIYNGYFVEQRFGSVSGDLAKRLRHWGQTLAMMDHDPATMVFGMGFGKFPVTYYWHNTSAEVPPSYRYVDQNGNRLLRLSSGEHLAGLGEPLRLWQTIAVRPGGQYLLAVDVWNGGPPAFLHLDLCERQLLYRRNCINLPVRQLPAAPYWQPLRFSLNAGALGSSGAPVRLELAAQGQGALLDVDNVSLRDARDHHQLVRNGDFSAANNYWFFSSDHHHLPWHIKNLGLNLYFEMGWPGLLAYATLVSSAAALLMRRALREQRGRAPGGGAAAWLAALLAFQTVGLFDSLLDAPRITLIFMLLLCSAALQPAPPSTPERSPS